MRREKKETDLKLPPKKEIVIYAPITDVQQELYKATLNKHMEILLNQKKVISVCLIKSNYYRYFVSNEIITAARYNRYRIVGLVDRFTHQVYVPERQTRLLNNCYINVPMSLLYPPRFLSSTPQAITLLLL